MRTLKKQELLAENARLSHALSLHEQYLTHAFRSQVTFIRKGNYKLGICGETRAHGGIVLEAMRNSGDSDWSVVGVFYWEKYASDVRNYPLRHDDQEGQDRMTCAEQVQKHVSAAQAKFYAPKVLEAVS